MEILDGILGIDDISEEDRTIIAAISAKMDLLKSNLCVLTQKIEE